MNKKEAREYQVVHLSNGGILVKEEGGQCKYVPPEDLAKGLVKTVVGYFKPSKKPKGRYLSSEDCGLWIRRAKPLGDDPRYQLWVKLVHINQDGLVIQDGKNSFSMLSHAWNDDNWIVGEDFTSADMRLLEATLAYRF